MNLTPDRPPREVAIGLCIAGGGSAGALLALAGLPLLGLVIGLAPLVLLLVPVLVQPLPALALLFVSELTSARSIAGGGGFSLYRVVFGLALVAVVLGWWRRVLPFAWSPVLTFAALYLGARAISVLVAQDRVLGMTVVVESSKQLLFLWVAFCLLGAVRSWFAMVRLTVVVVAVLASLTAAQEFVLHNRVDFAGLSKVISGDGLGVGRHTGPLEDPNFWGLTLVLFMPFGLSLLAMRSRQRWLWAPAVAAIAVGEYLTQSRGGFIAFTAAVLAWMALAGGLYRKALLLAPAVLMVGLMVPGVGSRLSTLSTLREAASRGEDLSYRLAAQQVSVAMFVDHPTLGIGTGNFTLAAGDYQRRAGLVTSTELGVHSVYMEMASEGGLLGITTWLLFYFAAVFVGARALVACRRLDEGRSPSPAAMLAVGVLAALTGWAVGSLFLPLAYPKVLYIVMALAASLDIEVRRRAAGQLAEPRRRPSDPRRVDVPASPGRRKRRWRTAAALTLVPVGLLATVLLVVAPRLAWDARSTARITKIEGVPDNYGLIQRVLASTYAAVVSNDRFRDEAAAEMGLDTHALHGLDIRVTGSDATGVVTVSARARDARLSQAMAYAVLSAGRRYIDTLGLPYVLDPPRPTGSPRRVSGGVWRSALIGLAGLSLAVFALPLRRSASASR